MEYIKLGNTGISVSKLCFGALTVGPLQKNMSVKDGAEVMAYAFEKGINFVDTAQLYKTYPYIKVAMDISSKKDIVIATKTYAYDKKTAMQAFDEARRGLDRDYIDIFMLHEQESEHTLKGHFEAIEFFLKCRQKGQIKAFGISTHHIAAVKASLNFPEIEVIMPMINYKGIGIVDGTIERMLQYVKRAFDLGKGIYGMKALGGGTLIGEYKNALNFALDLDCVHSVALGMQSKDEVDANIEFLKRREVSDFLKTRLNTSKRKLHIDDWCIGCGRCVKVCKNKALQIDKNTGKVLVDNSKCVVCGYCGRACKEFAIKVI